MIELVLHAAYPSPQPKRQIDRFRNFYAASEYYVRPVVTDRVASSVGLSVILVSPEKTAEAIEMRFGLKTRVGPGNHILDGVQILHEKRHF